MLIDTESNAEAYRRMVESIRSGRPYGFCGAGVTQPLGYPTWEQLIRLLAEEVRRVCGDNVVDTDDNPQRLEDIFNIRFLPVKAEFLKYNLGERYLEFMRETFGPVNRRADSIDDLVALPFKHLLTSNYDPTLECAIVNRGGTAHSICLVEREITDFLHHRADDGYERCVVHVHGIYDRPDTLVLTEADYAKCYNDKGVETFWDNIVGGETCVFFGFSFADDGLTNGFNLNDFDRVNRKIGAVHHFALVPNNDPKKEAGERMSLRRRYGVEPVFYNPHDAQYSGYAMALRRLRQDVPPSAATSIIEPQAVAHAPAHEGVVAVEAAVDENRVEAGRRDLATLEQLTEQNIGLYNDGDF
jgi:SIR2-like domain